MRERKQTLFVDRDRQFWWKLVDQEHQEIVVELTLVDKDYYNLDQREVPQTKTFVRRLMTVVLGPHDIWDTVIFIEKGQQIGQMEVIRLVLERGIQQVKEPKAC